MLKCIATIFAIINMSCHFDLGYRFDWQRALGTVEVERSMKGQAHSFFMLGSMHEMS